MTWVATGRCPVPFRSRLISRAARRVLTTHQRSVLRSVGGDAAAAATAAALRTTPESTEYAVAAVLAEELLERALDPVVLLVAGEHRMRLHRHPLPTTRLVGRRVMLVCCARRDRLIASVTRIVSFDPLPARDWDCYRRLLDVERAFLDATVPGARLGDIVASGTAAYARYGFAADEWHRHHQGGFTALQPREYPADAASVDVVEEGCALAWNPSADGWKVEDTCIVGSGGVEPVVFDPRWPVLEVAGRHRPAVLVR